MIRSNPLTYSLSLKCRLVQMLCILKYEETQHESNEIYIGCLLLHVKLWWFIQCGICIRLLIGRYKRLIMISLFFSLYIHTTWSSIRVQLARVVFLLKAHIELIVCKLKVILSIKMNFILIWTLLCRFCTCVENLFSLC